MTARDNILNRVRSALGRKRSSVSVEANAREAGVTPEPKVSLPDTASIDTHIAAHPNNRWLFQTRRNTKFTTRRVQQIVKHYADAAGVIATPHTFRHQAITWLTRHSGMADAELQLITGHARRETLAIYQHVALDGELEAKYPEAMKKADL